MPRRPRIAPGGLVYHVLNRAVARLALFEKDADYEAFERVLAEAMERHPTRLLSYAVMPNHWHMVIWPREDGELTRFVRWLTHTHVMRWHAHFKTSGSGHLYQGRFKSFPVQTDEHFYTLLRYVERNARRANLVQRAEEWRWSSLWRRVSGDRQAQRLLHRWPLPAPADWLEHVNRPQTEAELKAVRRALQRGTPFGSSQWQLRTAKRLGPAASGTRMPEPTTTARGGTVPISASSGARTGSASRPAMQTSGGTSETARPTSSIPTVVNGFGTGIFRHLGQGGRTV